MHSTTKTASSTSSARLKKDKSRRVPLGRSASGVKAENEVRQIDGLVQLVEIGHSYRGLEVRHLRRIGAISIYPLTLEFGGQHQAEVIELFPAMPEAA